MAPSDIPTITTCILILTVISLTNAVQTDINCLKSFKESIEDPDNLLSNWNFNNNTEGFICKFTGIECWHPDESKVLNIRLADMGLKGMLPPGLENCTSMTGLDLSNNHLFGSLPTNITKVPVFRNKSIGAESYAGNPGLCGGPLRPCTKTSKKTSVGVVIGAAIGGATLAVLVVGVAMTIFMRKVVRKNKDDDPDGNRWAKSIKGAKTIKLSMFENPVSKMRLSDLMKATDSFSKDHIIGSGRTGCLYKAVLEDGNSLMIKRLQDTQHSEKEFASEMATLGKVKHRNLVPLLGFCVTKTERFLVYKYMANGTLHDKLHTITDDIKRLDWPSRLKIGIGAAKGLAWLHHNCNPRVLHRNISSKCILLDADLEPKISDFGLARLMNPVDTHLSTFVNGEFGDLGYVAPEYTRTLVATPKGDVYSFGVVLLELATGEKPTHVAKAPETFKGSLAEWVMELSAESRLEESIDESINEKRYSSEVFQFLKVACSCVGPAHKERPTMFEVYQLLRAIGQHYHFSTDDEVLMMPTDNGDAGQIELIVAR
ncbi:putative transferase, protein kinase RLK-Pelle-LRR-Xa family [Helianthus annuus]|nr:putative transferase, protein kinase RLK-Pelle-LRR-Xa family [Helianthus annuus]